MKQRTRSIITALIITAICLPTLWVMGDAMGIVSASFIHATEAGKSKKKYYIEYGHGSIEAGKYLTSGKQSPQWPDGLKIYEGYSNQILAYELVARLRKLNLDAAILNPDSFDMPLADRANLINRYFHADSRVVLISLHHNAQPTDRADYTDRYGVKGYTDRATGGASGTEIYTSPGTTASDRIATLIYNHLSANMPYQIYRTDRNDGDPDKEANFYVLTKTDCPAVLIEWQFMTTYSDCLIIADDTARADYITSIANALKQYDDECK